MRSAGDWHRINLSASAGPVPQVYLAIPPPTDPTARLLSSIVGLDEVELEYDAFNRPRITAAPGVTVPDISISRRPEAMVVAVYAEGRVGVDVDVASRTPSAELLANSLTADELAAFHPDNAPSTFFRLWAAKEAFLKAIGQGLVFGLKQVELDLASDGNLRIAKVRGSTALAKGWHIWTTEVPIAAAPVVVAVAWAR